jgi:DNA-binding NarL/FixJ family response regulator
MLASVFRVVGTILHGKAVVEAEGRLHPDVVVMDSSAPVMSRIEAAKQMRKKTSKVEIVFLTMHQDSRIMAAAKLAGGLGYVVKTRQGMDPARAIDEVLADHSVLPSSSGRYI